MKLTDIQFARCAAFVLGLRVIDAAIGCEAPLNTEAVKSLQDLTVERSNQIASELGVSFPDETERETPESLAEFNAAMETEAEELAEMLG